MIARFHHSIVINQPRLFSTAKPKITNQQLATTLNQAMSEVHARFRAMEASMETLAKGLGVRVEVLETKGRELDAEVSRLADVSQNHEHQLKLLIASNRNLDTQIEDDASQALRDHFEQTHTHASSTTFERCPYLHGKLLFERDGIIATEERGERVLWLIEAKRLVRHDHITITVPTKLRKTADYINMAQNLDFSRFPEQERKSAAQWTTCAHHKLRVVIASPNITRIRALQILTSGFYCMRNTVFELYQVFSLADIDNSR